MRSDERCTGTSLAAADGVPEAAAPATPIPDSLWRGQRNQFFYESANQTSRVVIGLGCFMQAATIAFLYAGGTDVWRIAVLAALYVAFALAHKLVIKPMSDPSSVETGFIRMNVIAQLFVVSSASITGGIHSPFLPSLVLPAVVSLLFFGPYPVARWTAVGNFFLIVAMVFLPSSVVGSTVPATYYTVLVLMGLGWHLFMLHLMVGKLTTMSTRASDSMACLREERVTEAIAHLRRLQSVGAKVAHELKNPLASIKGLCQLVARTPESERTQERLAVVASEISRMETILAEYLSFSRPLEDLKPEMFDVAALARDVLDIVAGRADQAGVALDIEAPPTQVKGDSRRLKEALINLVSNAVEATPSGGRVSLRVRTAPASVTIDVRDTGRGIASEDLERLGTSFFTTRPNGTGLGVVLAQSVITQHGGTLDYKSAEGQGTTATITLPVETSPAPSIASPATRVAMIEARS
ncbi:MAG: sensor histidine kinase [Kofleriaceae bacterium]